MQVLCNLNLLPKAWIHKQPFADTIMVRRQSRDKLARVRASTLTPFAMSSIEAYSSGLWLKPATKNTTGHEKYMAATGTLHCYSI